MATQVKHRRGTNAEILAGVPAIGELWFNTTDNSIHMGDGVTLGGIKHLNANMSGVLYKASSGKSAVENMKSGSPVSAKAGDIVSTGVTKWEVNTTHGVTLDNGLYAYPVSSVNVRDFGAVGDGVTDDREALQSALDVSVQYGFMLDIPECDGHYSIGSKHPVHTESGLILDASDNAGAASLTIQGCYYKSVIKADVAMTHLVRGVGRCSDITMNDVYFHANNLADNAVFSDDNVFSDYSPYWTLKGCRFQSAIDTGLALSSFVASLDKCLFAGCVRGLYYRGIDGGPTTSTNFNNCYAQDCDVGYQVAFITYGAMTACAADRCDVAYKLSNTYGFNMTACGAELCRKAIEFNGARMTSINTFYGLEIGSADNQNPEPYLIDFVSGSRDVTVNGIYINNTARYYTYKIAMNSVSNGGENFHILDDSVTRAQVFQSSNNSYEHRGYVFKFAWDQVDRDQTINVANVTEFIEAVNNLKFKKINADVTINVTGAIDQVDTLLISDIYAGAEKLIINGNGNTFSRLQINSSNIVFVDCNFPSAGGGYNNAVTTVNSTVTFKGCLFTSTGNAGAAVFASKASIITIGEGTTVIGTGYSFQGIYNSYHDEDGTTTWHMSPVTPVTNLRLPIGEIVGTIGTANTLISCKVESGYSVGSANWKLI